MFFADLAPVARASPAADRVQHGATRRRYRSGVRRVGYGRPRTTVLFSPLASFLSGHRLYLSGCPCGSDETPPASPRRAVLHHLRCVGPPRDSWFTRSTARASRAVSSTPVLATYRAACIRRAPD